MVYEAVHRKVLSEVRDNGGMAGIDLYRKNVATYEEVGPCPVFNVGVRRKLELISAVEKREGLLGASVSGRNRGEPLMTGECVDVIIDMFYSALNILSRKGKIPIAHPYPSN